MYSCTFFTPLSLSLSVYQCIRPPLPPSPAPFLYLNIFPLPIHSSIRGERLKSTVTVLSGVNWQMLPALLGWREWARRRAVRRGEEIATKMESSWKGEGEAGFVYCLHNFWFLLRCLFNPQFRMFTCFLPPPLKHTCSLSFKLIPYELSLEMLLKCVILQIFSATLDAFHLLCFEVLDSLNREVDFLKYISPLIFLHSSLPCLTYLSAFTTVSAL